MGFTPVGRNRWALYLKNAGGINKLSRYAQSPLQVLSKGLHTKCLRQVMSAIKDIETHLLGEIVGTMLWFTGYKQIYPLQFELPKQIRFGSGT